jgi:hypothetical protein
LTHGNRRNGTLKKGLHRARLNAIILILTAAGSHPDCRAILIQIVALYFAVFMQNVGAFVPQDEPKIVDAVKSNLRTTPARRPV